MSDVAIILGGGDTVFAEFDAAARLCAEAGKSVDIFAVNDMIGAFLGSLDHAVTVHPDKIPMWRAQRAQHGFLPPEHWWSIHNGLGKLGITDTAQDWQGSSGLFAVRIARELGYVKIILCGVPMTIEAKHFKRGVKWWSCLSFRRGWIRRFRVLKPYVRSMSGWTQQNLGPLTLEWLNSHIVDQHRLRRQPAPRLLA